MTHGTAASTPIAQKIRKVMHRLLDESLRHQHRHHRQPYQPRHRYRRWTAISVDGDYDQAGKRTIGGPKSQETWHLFYERYPPGARDDPEGEVVGWFQR
jgi:hypothetical protein